MSRSLHLPKVLLSQFSFQFSISFALPPPQPKRRLRTRPLHFPILAWKASVHFPSFTTFVCGSTWAVGALTLASVPVFTTFSHARGTTPCHPIGIQPLLLRRALSVCLGHCLPDSDGTRRSHPFLPYPFGVILPGACCPCPDHASFLPFVRSCRGSSHRARCVGHGSCRGVAQVTANTGPRPTRRVLTRGHALRACSLCAPFPPRPLSPVRFALHFVAASVGGRGLRSPLSRATVSPNPFSAERRF